MSEYAPRAWPLQGYAPGSYGGRCHDCGQEAFDLDKRAWRCLECAARDANRFMHERCVDIEKLQHAVAEFAEKVERQADCLEKYAEGSGFSGEPVPSVFHFQASHFRDFARELRAASCDRNPQGQDREAGLGAEHESAVGSEAGETPKQGHP